MDTKESRRPDEKGKRYNGYDMKKAVVQNSNRKKPWFWKVLGISLIFTAIILGVVSFIAVRTKKQQTDYLAKINDANTMDLLLEDHSNATIVQSFSNLKDKDDYKTTRFVKNSSKGTLYSYLKTEGLEEDYKEVLKGKNLYRYDGSYAYYYGFVKDDYATFLDDIKGEVFQLEGTEKVAEQNESTDVIKAKLTYEVQAGDQYTSLYGLETGTTVTKTLTINKDTMLVTSDVETINDDKDQIYSYSITFDGKNKVPKFYRTLKSKKTTRNCVVYFDYKGDNQEKLTYKIPVDTYFDLLTHDGYTVYMDSSCKTEFSKTNMQIQNPYTDLTLYVKKDDKK